MSMLPSSGVCDIKCTECPFETCAKDILENAGDIQVSDLVLVAPEIVEIPLNLEGQEWWD